MIFWFIVLGAPLSTLGWWVVSHGIIGRGLVAGAGGNWQKRWALHVVVAMFFGMVIGTFVWVAAERGAGLESPPLWARTLTLVWYVAALPASCLVMGAALATVFFMAKSKGRPKTKAAGQMVAAGTGALGGQAKPQSGVAAASDEHSLDESGYSRRRFLATTALAAPPLLTAGFGIKSSFDQGQFRTREHRVAIENLPRELEGLTIAHVSDVHIGRYTNTSILKRIVDATNNLRCDLIAMTGDLIDFNISDLPEAITMVRRLDAPGGVVLCEGNHDLFDNGAGFRSEMRSAGIDLLVNQSILRKLRGIECEISGLRWGVPGSRSRDAQFEENFASLAKSADAGGSGAALRMHLVHHPHAFDAAGDAGIDLTLAGHTHGGQLMLADRIGPASLLYKYVSGLYTRRNPAGKTVSCIVSNGTGNWLPLRLSAPAEIARITLVRA